MLSEFTQFMQDTSHRAITNRHYYWQIFNNPDFYHKSSHYYPSSLCLFRMPDHLQDDEKKTGTQLIFPQPCLPGSCSCLCSAMPHHRAGQPGLKLAEPWRATSNLRTRLASRAEQSTAQSDINEKPSRAFQQAH